MPPSTPTKPPSFAALFEGTLRALNLSDRADPITTLVAKKIIELASHGERDASRLHQAVINFFYAGR
jgi:hypothetical protein